MRRVLVLLGLVLLLGAVAPAQGRSTKTMTLSFTIFQEATHRHAHPPPGDAGDSYSTTLLLNNAVPQFGKGVGSHVGSMSFAYTLSGNCASASGCTGTTNITTVSYLPGGTITAASNNVPLGKRPFVVQVQSGTGAFKGVKGKVEIAPGGDAKQSYVLTLP